MYLYFLAIGFSNDMAQSYLKDQLISFSIGMQYDFFFFCVFPSNSPKTCDEISLCILCPVLQKRLQLHSKTDLTRTGLILEFFVGILVLSPSYLHGLKFAARIAQLCFSFDNIKSFR